MVTIELVDEAWKKFDDIKDNAEQHEFASIVCYDMILTKYYRDLHRNWDEDHARRFLIQMNTMFDILGYPRNKVEIPA